MRHFEQANTLITEEMMARAMVCAPGPERHRRDVQQYLDAGYNEVHVQQIGDGHEGQRPDWTQPEPHATIRLTTNC